MVAHLVDRMEIQDIAELWGQEEGKPSGIYVRALIDFLTRKNAVEYGYDPAFSSVHPGATLTRDHVQTFCEESQIDLPRFWFGAKESLAGAETQCRKWLADQISRGNRKTKSEYRKVAAAEIEGLSARAFNRVWEAMVPLEWKRAGRPKKS